jgi:hypothetical protein
LVQEEGLDLRAVKECEWPREKERFAGRRRGPTLANWFAPQATGTRRRLMIVNQAMGLVPPASTKYLIDGDR